MHFQMDKKIQEYDFEERIVLRFEIQKRSSMKMERVEFVYLYLYLNLCICICICICILFRRDPA